jgi:DNA gyrase subunit A
MDKEEFIATALTIREFTPDRYFLFVTRKGMVKRTAIDLYKNVRVGGIRAVNLNDGDELLDVKEVPANAEILLATEYGQGIRFSVSDVRPMGRSAAGVKGIALAGKDRVASGVVFGDPDRNQVLTVSANGYGKRSDVELYRLQSRSGKGVINMKVTAKTGQVVGATSVCETDDILLLTSANKIIRTSVSSVRNVGRAAQGVTLVNMEDGDQVVGFDIVEGSNAENGGD